MKIKKKENTTFKLTLTERELDHIQLAIAVLLQDPNTHLKWKTWLGPTLEQMREALGEHYEW